jgi:ABC-type antimicrobial peptide transport system permease subunit
MNWVDALTLASRSLRRRPGRALLTILAVTLGTTLLVALASVASSAGSRIVSKLSNGGPATAIKVSASKADSDQSIPMTYVLPVPRRSTTPRSTRCASRPMLPASSR